MTQPDIQINSEAMRRHAGVVDETGAMIDKGAQAGAWVRASNDAYGVMFGWFAGKLNPVQDDLVGGIKEAATAAQTLADLIRATADDMDLTDANAAHRLGGK
ncbi:type VII secretion target [Actinoplanes sp. NPDC048988]|uniref:type VII secretion target n=1 Tax=Actinoplanes sp. NPDC048988 TaxID=3363901 RepID=UPI00371E17DA